MDVLGDAIGRDRRSSDPALRTPAVDRNYDYRRFCTNAWKVGNFLRHHGVRGGATVGIADDPLPEPVLTFYGAALLGGIVKFAPSVDTSPRALVVPETEVDSYDPEPGTKVISYGNRHDDPSVAYFERDVWSENPTQPPDRIAPTDPLVWADGQIYTHGDVLTAAERVVENASLERGDEVAVRSSFADPGVVAAGLVAPIVAGGTVVLGSESTGDIVVGGPSSDVATETLLDG